MKIMTIRDIASMAGVSITTVSRVLNGKPDVNSETRERVERIIRDAHFVGNASARSLKQTDTETVAVILRGRQNPFLNSLAEDILHHTAQLETAFIVEYIDEQADEFAVARRLFNEKRVSGFIFAGSRPDGRARILDGLDAAIVFATVENDSGLLPDSSSVSVDDRSMAAEACSRLIAMGHTRIAVFGGRVDPGDSLSRRYQGIMDAFSERGLSFDTALLRETRFSLSGGYDCTRDFFKTGSATAIFCMSDIVALGAIRALHDLGLRVPEDVSVFGYDGLLLGEYSIPSLSTVVQPVDEIAKETVNVMMAMLHEHQRSRHVTIPARVLMRESTAEIRCSSADDPES